MIGSVNSGLWYNTGNEVCRSRATTPAALA
jgi:hypothetical protein